MRTSLALLALAAPAFAQDLVVRDGRIRIARHEVEVDVDQQVATTSVTQVFTNVDSRVREVCCVVNCSNSPARNRPPNWPKVS